MNNIISDEYYNYGDLINIKRKKEPYIFTITSTNSIGNSVISDPTNDVLPKTVPTIKNFVIEAPTIERPVGGDIMTPQLRISFDIDDGGSNITSFEFKNLNPSFIGNPTVVTPNEALVFMNFGIMGSMEITPVDVGINPKATSGTYKFILSNLSPGVNYQFGLTASNNIGNSLSVSSNSVKTFSVPDSPTITNVTASDNTECTVSFDLPDERGTPITSYTVTAISSSGSQIIQTGTTSPIKIKGLTGGTSYTFIVSATNAIGTGSASLPSRSIMIYDKPTAPIINDVSKNDNGKSTVTFSGGNLNGSTGNSPLYTVTATPVNGSPITATGNSSPIIVNGLTNGIKYTFNVTITTTNNGSATSQSVEATLSDIPSKIDSTSFQLTSDTNLIRLKFNKPNTNGSDITNYVFNAYYTDSTGKIYKEIITIPVDQVTNNSDGTVTAEFKTTQRNKYDSSKLVSSLTSAEINSVTTNTLSVKAPVVQKYDRVPLKNYPIGNERKNQICFNSVCFYICLIIFIVIIVGIFRKCFSRR
jgi:hypothetical protein